MTNKQPAVVQHALQLAGRGEHLAAASVLQTEAEASSNPAEVSQWLMQAGLWLQRLDPPRALALLKRALQADSELTRAWLSLAVLEEKAGRSAAACDAALQVVRLQAPAAQRLDAANLLVRQGQVQVGLQAAQIAYDELGRPLAQAGIFLTTALSAAAWDLVEALTAQLSAAYQAGNFASVIEGPRTHLLWCADEVTNIGMVRQWSQRLVPELPAVPLPPGEPLAGRRLRVGYLSSDYRNHATSWLVHGLFRNHDRQKLELFAYCCGWDDRSEIRCQVLSHFDAVHSLAALSDAAAAELIRSHRLDVLVDLNGPTRFNRLSILAHRVAPVQISYLGFPGSAGGRFVDYIVADSYTIPPGKERLFPEKVIRIHPTYQVNDYAARTLPPPPSRQAVGLPMGVRVAGMFNAIDKVGREVWLTWMQILRRSPRTVLWVLDPGEVARRHLLAASEAAGVPRAQILWAPKQLQQVHLARMQCCDLMLDPWPYGGHTTTADALFSNVPVLALEGTNFASRVSGALLRSAGLQALVQPDRAAYVNLAVRLLDHPAELDKIRNFMRRNTARTDVFNAASQAHQLEAAYLAAARRAERGLPARNITVKP